MHIKTQLNHQLDATQIFKYCNKPLLNIIIFSTFINILILAGPIYSLQVLDRVLSSQSIPTLISLTSIVCAAYVTVAILFYVRATIAFAIGKWIDKNLSRLIIKQNMSDIAVSSGNKAYNYFKQMNTIKNFIIGGSMFSLFDIPWSVIYVIIVSLINPVIGFITFIGISLIIASTIIMEKYSLILNQNLIESENNAMRNFDILTHNALGLEIMGITHKLLNKWSNIHNQSLTLNQQIYFRSNLLSSLIKFCRLFLQMLTLALGAYFIILDKMTIGGMIANSILIARAVSPCENLMRSWRDYLNSKKAYKSLVTYLSQTNIHKIDMIHDIDNTRYHNLLVENLEFQYDMRKTCLIKDINLYLDNGQSLIIQGACGTGKSTLVKLLTGIIRPTKGIVRINNSNIYKWNRDELGKYIGYLGTHCSLFPGSIKENISKASHNIDHDKIIESATISGAHDVILRLPEGYDTITEDDEKLSYFQSLKIALARSIFMEPKLLIFDSIDLVSLFGNVAKVSIFLKEMKKKNIIIILVSNDVRLRPLFSKVLHLKEDASYTLTQAPAARTNRLMTK